MKNLILRWVGLGLLCALLPGLWNGLKEAHYPLDTPVSGGQVRIVFISDLHDCAYGEEMADLIAAVDRQQPDLVLLGGDLFSDGDASPNTVRFLEEIAGKYPCYYVTGNHEYRGGEGAFASRMAVLERLGIRRLSGQMVSLDVNGIRLNLCGVDDPVAWDSASGFEEQLRGVAALPRNGAYTILLTHRPEYMDLYAACGFDLVLAGHTHGGQWRFPLLLNGVYASGQGYFPEYAGGKYEQDGTVMIVGRGVTRRSAKLPRIYNPPELVIVDLE